MSLCGLLSGVIGLVVIPGCDAEVGSKYEGEALFNLHGKVLNYGDVDTNRILVLSFYGGNSGARMDGRVTGEFPANFTFTLTTPPPEEAFVYKDYLDPWAHDGTTGRDFNFEFSNIAFAQFALLHEDYNDLPLPPEMVCDDGLNGGRCVMTQCTEQGRCKEQTKQCELKQSEVVFSAGDRSWLEADTSRPHISNDSFITIDGFGYIFKQVCAADGSADCLREVTKTEIADVEEGSVISRDGSYLSCTLLEESGDTSISKPFGIFENVDNYAVLYAIDDIKRPFRIHSNGEENYDIVDPLPRGYSLAKISPINVNKWIAYSTCVADKHIQAIVDYNDSHDTNYISGVIIPEKAMDAIVARREELLNGCPEVPGRKVTVVEDYTREVITIEIGRP
jgi:hypothetical protein